MKPRHQNIEILQSENELLSAVVRNSADAIVTISADCTITSWNKAAEGLLGYSAGEMIGLHALVVVPNNNISAAAQLIDDIIAGKQIDHFVTSFIRKDKSLIKVSISLSYLQEDNFTGSIACIIRNTVSTCKTMPTDIGEINEMLEQKVAERTFELQEANKALEAFSYSVSHDLKSPVRAIYSFTKIISKDYNTQLSPEIIELLGHIETNSRRMNCIIEDLLALAKHSRSAPELQPVDMEHLFNVTWQNLQIASPGNAKLELGSLPVVYADASMIEQVVVNLLSNAVKYSSRNQAPVVKVGAEYIDEKLTFFVKDNGAGFDMQYYDRLFGVFERLHNLSDFEGTGIGLFLVKRIIDKHNGAIWADARVNEGASFYFTLPQSNN